jgi:hypothetical protein
MRQKDQLSILKENWKIMLEEQHTDHIEISLWDDIPINRRINPEAYRYEFRPKDMSQADTYPTRAMVLPPTTVKNILKFAKVWDKKTNNYKFAIMQAPYDLSKENVKTAKLQDTTLNLGLIIDFKSQNYKTSSLEIEFDGLDISMKTDRYFPYFLENHKLEVEFESGKSIVIDCTLHYTKIPDYYKTNN